MQDRPNAADLAEAVRGFLEAEILPALQDQRLKFRALVAANALAILGRDLQLGEAAAKEEVELLSNLLGESGDALALNQSLAARIRAGKPPEGTLAALRRVAEIKLKIASPKYLEPSTKSR